MIIIHKAYKLYILRFYEKGKAFLEEGNRRYIDNRFLQYRIKDRACYDSTELIEVLGAIAMAIAGSLARFINWYIPFILLLVTNAVGNDQPSLCYADLWLSKRVLDIKSQKRRTQNGCASFKVSHGSAEANPEGLKFILCRLGIHQLLIHCQRHHHFAQPQLHLKMRPDHRHH